MTLFRCVAGLSSLVGWCLGGLGKSVHGGRRACWLIREHEDLGQHPVAYLDTQVPAGGILSLVI